MEINKSRYFVTVAVPPNPPEIKEELGVLGIDHNCGVERAILNCADLKKGTTFGLGKKGPKIRLKYRKKRKKQKIKGNKEHRIMKDLDHKISRRVVNYALKNKLRIVLENLQGIRKRATKRKTFPSSERRRELLVILSTTVVYRIQGQKARYTRSKSFSRIHLSRLFLLRSERTPVQRKIRLSQHSMY